MTPLPLTFTARTVKGFLDYLLLSATHWNAAGHGQLAFRGQASSDWPLLPRAFRTGQTVGYGLHSRLAHPSRVEPQAQAEFRAVRDFVVAADDSGLDVASGGQIMLRHQDPQVIFGDPYWEYHWPQHEVLETVALAQHHGVPTRLLDFTQNPLIAAYFAASDVWELQNRQSRRRRIHHLAVWVIDLRFIRAVSNIRPQRPERIREIRVPRANNSYLDAQAGLFLIDWGANDVMGKGGTLLIDEIILQSANYWLYGDRLSGHDIAKDWFGDMPLRQVRLRTELASELLRELEHRGVTRATLMPSLDRVVEFLELRATIPDPGE